MAKSLTLSSNLSFISSCSGSYGHPITSVSYFTTASSTETFKSTTQQETKIKYNSITSSSMVKTIVTSVIQSATITPTASLPTNSSDLSTDQVTGVPSSFGINTSRADSILPVTNATVKPSYSFSMETSSTKALPTTLLFTIASRSYAMLTSIPQFGNIDTEYISTLSSLTVEKTSISAIHPTSAIQATSFLKNHSSNSVNMSSFSSLLLTVKSTPYFSPTNLTSSSSHPTETKTISRPSTITTASKHSYHSYHSSSTVPEKATSASQPTSITQAASLQNSISSNSVAEQMNESVLRTNASTSFGVVVSPKNSLLPMQSTLFVSSMNLTPSYSFMGTNDSVMPQVSQLYSPSKSVLYLSSTSISFSALNETSHIVQPPSTQIGGTSYFSRRNKVDLTTLIGSLQPTTLQLETKSSMTQESTDPHNTSTILPATYSTPTGKLTERFARHIKLHIMAIRLIIITIIIITGFCDVALHS